MRGFALIAATAVPLLVLTACGLSSSSKDDKADDDNAAWEYEYEHNGCKTGVVSGTGKAERCEALLDEKRNRGCASEMRLREYELQCGKLPDDTDPKSNGENPGSSDARGGDPTPGPSPSPTVDEGFCGYKFDEGADTSVVRAVLEGPWVSRSPGVMTDSGPAGDRTYKDGFYFGFGFGSGEISPIKVFQVLDGADLRAAAISIPWRAEDIRISKMVERGDYAGWHLIQWKTGSDGCLTVGVVLERRDGELDNTLVMIGPRMVSGGGAVPQPTMDDFFRDLVSTRDFKKVSSDLPRWD